MGGHGGLNILPQKRWNVYNRDNRAKVEKDEREYQEALQKQKEKQLRSEQQQRREILLQRQGVGSKSEKETHKFTNFWQQEEAALAEAQRSETQEKLNSEQRKRGKPDYYTSDAKFDEKFQFAYGVKDSVPWYAKRQKLSPPNESHGNQQHSQISQRKDVYSQLVDSSQLLNAQNVKEEIKQQQQGEDGCSAKEGSEPEGGQLTGMGVKLLTKKEMKQHQHRKKKDKGSKGKSLKSIEELRQERIEREKAERQRANLVLSANGQSGNELSKANGQGYYSGFGYGKVKQRQ